MKTREVNNLGLKIASVVLAILLWMIVLNIEDPVITRSYRGIEVEIINEDAISGKNKTYEIEEGDTVDVYIKARRSILDEIRSGDVKAEADLSKLSLTMAVPIDVSVTRYSSRIEDIALKNNDILKLKLEDMTQKELPITVVTSGEAASGYVVGNRSSSPNIVTIKGAESLVNSIKEARVTVGIHGMSETYQKNFPIQYYTESGEEVKSNRLTMDAKKAKVSIYFYQEKEVDLNISVNAQAASGYKIMSTDYQPKTITIAAPDDVLERTDSITIDDIQLNNLKDDFQQTYSLNEYMPTEVMVTGTNLDAVVSVKVEKRKSASKKK
jgi:YbbR domain-containing protein